MAVLAHDRYTHLHVCIYHRLRVHMLVTAYTMSQTQYEQTQYRICKVISCNVIGLSIAATTACCGG